jgi:hypothetical protein
MAILSRFALLRRSSFSVFALGFLWAWTIYATPTAADFPQFFRFGPQLQELIDTREQEIVAQRDHWRSKCLEIREKNRSFFAEFEESLETGDLRLLEGGNSATYVLSDAEQRPRFIVKPCDEAMYCLYNPRPHYASPFHDTAFRIHPHIPLYRSCQTEALASFVADALATLAGYEGILVPQTHLALVPLLGCEKLCSVQRFAAHKGTLVDVLENQEAVDPISHELLMLFVWVIYDTDAHLRNFLIDPSSGRLVKIDNALSFPEQNDRLLNILALLPQSQTPLSEAAKELIQQLPVEQIVEKMHFFELEEACPAFTERCQLLKTLAQIPSLSKAQIDETLRLMY